ncbi:MAG: hypothetical protein QM770_08940 [Tepidisphaeraceae bacterium]
MHDSASRRHRFAVLACAVAFAGIPIVARAQTYVGPTGGNWGTAANWSTGLVPTASTDAVVNANASNVQVLVNVASNVRALTIDNGDSVSINNAQRLTLNGNLLNNGLLQIDAVNAATYLQPSGTVTLNGTGTIELADTTSGTNGWIYDASNVNGVSDHIINSSTHTIRGRGDIGFSSTLQITNHGLINADVAASALTLTPNTSGLLNTGTLRASGGGNLVLNGSGVGNLFTNTGATIEAQTGSTVTVDNIAHVVGGTLTSTGTGEFTVGSTAVRAIYDGLTHNATTHIPNGRRLDLVGTIVNNGTIRLDAVNAATYLQPSGTVTLNGTGTIELADTTSGTNGWIYDASNVNGVSDHIINSSTHTIRGRGDIGFSSTLQITNHGLINADVAASALTLTPNTSGLLNTGTLRASGGGNLVLNGSGVGNLFTNTGATIEAQTGSTVTVDNIAHVVGGTLTSTGTGEFTVGSTAVRAIYDGLTHNATTRIPNGRRLDLVGTIVNNGTIRLDAINADTYLQPNGTLTLNGTGAIVLNDDATGLECWFYDNSNTNSGTDHIINGATHSIRGAGNVGFSSTTQITNNGIIWAETAGRPLVLLPNAAGFVNNGLMFAQFGGILRLSEGETTAVYSGSGLLSTDVGSVIEAAAGATGELGLVEGEGTLRAVGSGASIGYRRLNVGSVDASTSGVVRLTTGGGNLGTSRVGTITLTSNGKFDIADHGVIVTGMTQADVRTLLAAGRGGGTWNGNNGIGSSLANNNNKAVGYVLASDIAAAPGTFLGQSFLLTDLLVRYTLGGDNNLDATVNFSDLLLLASNYGATGTGTWFKGDYNYDGNVNFNDLLVLASNYNQTLTGSFDGDWALAQSLLVPEPAMLGGMGLAALALRRRR